MTDLAYVDDELLIDPELLAFLDDAQLARYLELLQVAAAIDGDWRLQPRQQIAEDRCDELMAKGQTFELLYGGAGGGGKSEWLLFHLHRLALEYPGFNGLLIRRTYVELERTAILRSLQRFDRKFCHYEASKKRWRFDNGSIIEFGFCENDRDVYQYDSAEYDVVAWDELTQFPTDYPYRYLFSRLRTSLGKSIRGLVPHVIAGTNPHRTGVVWVKPRWVELGAPETVHMIDTTLDDGEVRQMARVFIPAKIADNRFINKAAYLEALALLDESTRKAIELGSWDVIEGQYFTEWNRELHVIRDFEVPAHWRRIGGLDFGIAAPFCHLWAAFDADGAAYVYREAYATDLSPSQQVNLIRSMELPGEQVDYRVADPSIWQRTGAGPPIAQQYLNAGLPFRKANNARIDGWARLRDYLRPIRPMNRDDGTEILMPSLFIMESCRNLIRTLPMLVHDDTKPEDVDTDGEDHAPDALRYLLMSQPRRTGQAPPRNADERAQRAQREADARRARGVYDHPLLGELVM